MHLSLSLNTKITVLTLLLMPVLLALGAWQLQRAEEKRVIQARFEARQQQVPVPIGALDDSSDIAFTPVSLGGHFDNQYNLLLDNRVHAGKLGYHVLTPLLTGDGQWVLVNRGWIQGYPDRRKPPDVPAVEGTVHTEGTVYMPPGEPFLLQDQEFRQPAWPLVIQAVEMDKLAAVLDRPLFPYVVRLRDNAPGALRIDWQPINVQPEKHVGYAVQWFAMATALALWFIVANTNLWPLLKSAVTDRQHRNPDS